MLFLLYKNQRPQITTRTDTLFPYTTLRQSELRVVSLPPTINSNRLPRNSRKGMSRVAGECAIIDIRSFPPGWSIRWSHRPGGNDLIRSEEHTSELQSLMRISYAVFCLTKKQ